LAVAAAVIDAAAGETADAESDVPGFWTGSIVPRRVRVCSIHVSAPSGCGAGDVLNTLDVLVVERDVDDV
jgi:hypothetical protein